MATIAPAAVTTTQPADDTVVPPLDRLYVQGRLAARIMVCLSALLFVIACVLPAFALREVVGGTARDEWSGGAILGMGWLGLFIGNLGWYANPPLVIGWVALARFAFGGPNARPGKTPLICGVIALVLGASVFQLSKIPANEGGGMNQVEQLLPGVFVWLGSIICLVLGGVGARVAGHTTRVTRRRAAAELKNAARQRTPA
jgi:hypothetical protein